MRLVFDLLQFGIGKSHGFEEVNCNILDYFKVNRDKIVADEIILVAPKGHIEFFKERYGAAYNYYELDASSYIKRLYYSSRVPSLLNLNKEDVIVYTGNTLPLFGGKCKKLLVVHDLLFRHGEFCSKTLHFWLFRLHKYIYIPSSLRRADIVIADSQCTKNEIIKYYHTDSNKVNVVYLYCNFDKYSHPEEHKVETPSSPYIFSVCSSAKHKNHTILLKAFEEAARKDKDLQYVLVGGLNPIAEPVYESLPAEIKERFHLMKNLSYADLAYLYKNAAAFVSASRYEGFGFPVVEALYFGLPCYLSDLAIHKEVSFNSSFYFGTDDWEKLAELLVKRPNKGDFSKKIVETYSVENTIGRYAELINLLSGERK
jgi:glycosyltransferase involved in cell wall biosynthesis